MPDDRKAGEGLLVHSERFERPTLGIEIRCSIQLSYECFGRTITAKFSKASPRPPSTCLAGRAIIGFGRRANYPSHADAACDGRRIHRDRLHPQDS